MSRLTDLRIYFKHIGALVKPGSVPEVLRAHPEKVGVLSGWKSADFELLIAEGRRQVDHYSDDLERARARGQALLTLSLPLLAAIGALLGKVDDSTSWVPWLLWSAAIVVGAVGALGSAATAMVAARLETIDAAALSLYAAIDLDRQLAADYAAIIGPVYSQLAARLTNLRIAATCLLLAGALGLSTWTFTRLHDAPPAAGPEPAVIVVPPLTATPATGTPTTKQSTSPTGTKKSEKATGKTGTE